MADATITTGEQSAPQRGNPRGRGPRRGNRGRGRGRGNQHANDSRIQFNTKRMEQHRFKTGMQTTINNQEDIKSEIFAFVTNEQLEKLTSNYNKKAQMLPVTSRNVGISTVSLLYTSIHYRHNLVIPNIYSMYRVFLAAFEARIINLRKQSGIMLRNSEAIYPHLTARANFIEDISRFNAYPLAIKMIVDAIGIVTDANDVAYLPVVAQSRRDDEGHLLPRPENLLLSNLRETVVELSDEDTPQEIRRRFHENNPIPGAQWSNNHLLLNPDDIIPEGYDINESIPNDIMGLTPFMSTLQKVAPKLVGGALDSKLSGKRSIFVSNSMGNLKVPDRGRDQTIEDYVRTCVPQGDVRLFSYNTTLSPAERLEGQMILVGEYPSVVNLLRPLYYKRESDQCAFEFEQSFMAVSSNLYGM